MAERPNRHTHQPEPPVTSAARAAESARRGKGDPPHAEPRRELHSNGSHRDGGVDAVPESVDVDLSRVMDVKGRRRHERPGLGSLLGANIWNPRKAAGGLSPQPLILLSALVFFTQIDTSAFTVLTPEIRDYFGVDLTTIALLTTLGGGVGVIVALPLGWLVDRVNRPKLAGIGTAVWALFTLLTGLAPGILALGVYRLGAGLGKSLETPVQQPLLADSYPPKVRGSVFAFSGLATNLALLVGPGFAYVAYDATQLWQAPFVLMCIPSFLLAVLLFARLRDPVRGEQERRAVGAGERAALTSQKPPSFAEAWRISWNVRTLRRLWYGVPFITGTASVIGVLVITLYDEKFHLGVGGRSLLSTLGAPAAIVGVIIGGAQVNRLLRFRPGRTLIFLSLAVAVVAGSFIVLAVTPWLAVAVAANMFASLVIGLLSPALGAVISLVTPPRVRGVAGGITALWAIPGVILGALAGNMGDRYGIAYSMVTMSIVFLIGAVIWSTAAGGVEPDMRSAVAASMAQLEVERSRDEGRAKLLVCRDLDVHYSNVQILFNVDFDVEEGEIIALLGTNGAGQSTLLRAISGLTAPSNGAVFFDAEDIT